MIRKAKGSLRPERTPRPRLRPRQPLLLCEAPVYAAPVSAFAGCKLVGNSGFVEIPLSSQNRLKAPKKKASHLRSVGSERKRLNSWNWPSSSASFAIQSQNAYPSKKSRKRSLRRIALEENPTTSRKQLVHSNSITGCKMSDNVPPPSFPSSRLDKISHGRSNSNSSSKWFSDARSCYSGVVSDVGDKRATLEMLSKSSASHPMPSRAAFASSGPESTASASISSRPEPIASESLATETAPTPTALMVNSKLLQLSSMEYDIHRFESEADKLIASMQSEMDLWTSSHASKTSSVLDLPHGADFWKSYLGIENSLVDLLSKLDSVESDGNLKIRETRKSMVQLTNQLLNRLDLKFKKSSQ